MVILLRSGWQSVNIGDIVHTDGFLEMAKKFLPGVEIAVWVSDDFPPEEEAMFRKYYPDTVIVKGRILKDGSGDNEALDKAVRKADILIHNSGPMLVAKEDVEAFYQRTGKPFGVWGITYDGNDYYTECLNHAEFLYFRDSVSLKRAKEKGLACPVLGLTPDVAFFATISEEKYGERYLEEHGLKKKEFVCCIPRLRYTPFWRIKKNVPFDERKQERNEARKEQDHRWLRETIVRVVRERGKKVLICPEDRSQMEVGKEMLYDRLPEDVRSMTVWKEDFWLPDEAISVYKKSACLFGNEMHSPIMCIANHIPAVVCRWEEQTSKGYMWKDMWLEDWLFDTDDEARMKKLPETVLGILDAPDRAEEKIREAQKIVSERTGKTVESLNAVKEKYQFG